MADHGEGGGGGHDGAGGMRWLLTYADLITLLMAFFIIMFAMSNLDKEKYAKVAQSLRISLGGGGGASMVVVGQGEGSEVKLPEDLYQRLQAQEAARAAAAGPGTGDPGAAPVTVKPGLHTEDPLLKVGQQLVADLKQYGRFHVYAAERGVIISLLGSAVFDSGKAEIRTVAEPMLAAIAQRLQGLPNDVSVEGSADDRPIQTAEFPSNWELSARRATEVIRHLVDRHGLDARRFIAVGYAEMRPVFDNTTAEGRAGNRRVDLIILRDRHKVVLGEELR